jgi:hypothetical protein
VIAVGVSSVGGLVWFLRRRSAGGRHEMPDTPGAHEDGNVHVEPDESTHPPLNLDWQRAGDISTDLRF